MSFSFGMSIERSVAVSRARSFWFFWTFENVVEVITNSFPNQPHDLPSWLENVSMSATGSELTGSDHSTATVGLLAAGMP